MKRERFPIFLLIFILFSSHIHSQKVNYNPIDQEELATILKNCAEYCERLGNSVLDFVCQEKITEEIHHYGWWTRPEKFEVAGGEIAVVGRNYSREDNVYVYDYQLIRKDNTVTERRILLRENNNKKNVKDAQLKTKRFKHKHLVFGPIGLLSEFWQQYYDYKVINKEKFRGDRVIVIEATPMPHMQTDNLYGKIWVKEDDFSILKIEWVPKSLKNYEIIEEEAKKLDAKPEIKFYAEYTFEKNGIRFPSKYYITEDFNFEKTYRFRRRKKYARSSTTVVYKDYKFFTVETEVSSLKEKK